MDNDERKKSYGRSEKQMTKTDVLGKKKLNKYKVEKLKEFYEELRAI